MGPPQGEARRTDPKGLSRDAVRRSIFEGEVNSETTGDVLSPHRQGSCLRLIDFVYHSTLGLRVIKQKKKGKGTEGTTRDVTPTLRALVRLTHHDIYSHLFIDVNYLHSLKYTR